MKRLIECVPNFSEGRDAGKVDAIVASMSKVPSVYVLDREMDADHNRCVITLAGDPNAVAEAALLGVGKAMELIDLSVHTGAHPRIGATDVVPFIPIDGVSIEDCVALARRVGNEIWNRYRIPVYFYEAAAQRPDRANLENIRRGQFEGLREEMKRDHNRLPDIGECKLHPTAGATVVGARKFLIAYNVNLNTSDIGIANKIAKAIRFSSGGLRYVKSMGVDLKARNLAQVSINLTDFEQTPMHRVYEMVKREAARYGVIPVGSEIVGLIPKKAIEMAADYFFAGGEFFADTSLREPFAGGADRRASGSCRETRKAGRAGAAVLGGGRRPDGNAGRRKRFCVCGRFGGFARTDGCRTLAEKEVASRRCGSAFRGPGGAQARFGRARRGNRPRCRGVRCGDGGVQAATGKCRRNPAARRCDSKRDARRGGGAASGRRAQRCAFRPPGTTCFYRRRIHEVRLGSGAADGVRGRARGFGECRD